MDAAHAQSAAATWSMLQLPGRFLQCLYVSNPFYVISAALVLFGLHAIFHDRDALAHPNALTFNSWLLLAILAAYALLLTATGAAIVRYGQVWDDARTILLSLLLLFVAVSVNGDKLILTQAESSGVNSGFGLFFLTPFLLCASLVVFEIARSVDRSGVQWFSIVLPAAFSALLLVATNRGAEYREFLAIYVREIGSPVVVSWWGLLALYVYAWWRGLRGIEFGVMGLLVVRSVIGTATVDVASLCFPSEGPLVLAAVLAVTLLGSEVHALIQRLAAVLPQNLLEAGVRASWNSRDARRSRGGRWSRVRDRRAPSSWKGLTLVDLPAMPSARSGGVAEAGATDYLSILWHVDPALGDSRGGVGRLGVDGWRVACRRFGGIAIGAGGWGGAEG